MKKLKVGVSVSQHKYALVDGTHHILLITPIKKE
jgi:hypothetical protein